MAWIKTVAIDQAEGLLQKIYQAKLKQAGRVFNLSRSMSLNPNTLRASMTLYQATMFAESPLSRAQRELLACVTSAANECRY